MKSINPINLLVQMRLPVLRSEKCDRHDRYPRSVNSVFIIVVEKDHNKPSYH